MFTENTYIQRRNKLKSAFKSGLLLIMGNSEMPLNYPSNTYHFRQDSTFLYFFGVRQPDYAAVIDIDNNKEIVFANDVDIEDVIWMGPQPQIKDIVKEVGITESKPYAEIVNYLQQAKNKGTKIHFLPPYRDDNKIKIHEWMQIPLKDVKASASIELIKAIVAIREIKETCEIEEIEKGIETAYEMHTTAMKMAKEGVKESTIVGKMIGIAGEVNGTTSFPIILSKHGETLHNHNHENILKNGDLLLVDCGFEAQSGYATDHTRVAPVGGKFSQKQKEIYQIVFDANEAAIKAIKPGVTYQSIHLLSAKVIAEGLIKLGLMKGNADEIVKNGAHAMFFPHGLGHMMGLDVHDMEDYGENNVGYDNEISRIDQFGTAYLRLGKRLKTGFVLTVEPGIYFIPALIDLWQKENKFTEYINYEKIREYIGFGGIRIEDDVLVTETGHRVLGKRIPKTIEEVENMCNS